jgi:hypothetical protein
VSALSRAARIAVLTLLVSCDLLRGAPFKVVEWSPGDGYRAPLSFSSVSVRFSSQPDRESVERAFTLEADGSAVRGTFAWDGVTVSFAPYSPFSAQADFVLTLSEDAHDEDGVSMDAAFEGRFSTRASGDRPSVSSTLPADCGTLPSATSAVEIRFSTPVDAAACGAAVSFSPSRIGSWTVDAAGTTARFAPAESWPLDAETTVTVSADLVDREGRKAGAEHRFSFRVGTEAGEPHLIEAAAIDAQGVVALVLSADEEADAAVTENPRWEGPWRLRLRFSEAVELASLDSHLTADGGPTLTRETALDRSDAAVYRFTERPEWGTRFAFRISAGVSDGAGNASSSASLFRITADGLRSRPPRLVGLRLPLAPEAADRELTAYAADYPYADFDIEAAHYPLDAATSTEIELYFELAGGASLDRNSIMEKFRVEATNDALSFSAMNVVTSGFVTAAPHAAWASYARCQVSGTLTNRTAGGVVTFSVAAGLMDSEGNVTGAAAALPLVE